LADVNYNLGKAYSNAQYLVQSLPYLEKSIKLYPDEPIFIAELAQAQAQTAAAFDQQIKSVQAAPNATPSGQAIKQAIAQKDSYIKLAIENINKALQANPYNLNTYKTKAKVEIYLGSIDQSYYLSSLKTLAKANELAPTDPKIVYNMGLLYDHLGQTSQAELAFKKTLELKSNYDQARVSYIELLKKQNNIPETKVQVQKLIEDYPEYEAQYKDIL
jgi:tetratricopeptide (TPR) repeat protein